MTKLLVQLKPGFKRTVKWNRYSSQMTIQSNNNNLNYLADSLFCHSKKLLEKIIQQKIKEILFSHYHVPNIKIKDFNAFIDGKSFFDLPEKNEEETYGKNHWDE